MGSYTSLQMLFLRLAGGQEGARPPCWLALRAGRRAALLVCPRGTLLRSCERKQQKSDVQEVSSLRILLVLCNALRMVAVNN